MDNQPHGSEPANELPAGIYRGVVDGIESGHCTARIEVRAADDGVFDVAGEYPMQIHLGYDGAALTWAWHWGTGNDNVVERSRATCRRVECRGAVGSDVPITAP